ncbi:MAG: glycosyltransferase [Candidatus Omnitrophota bacterium]|jgi:glycosyltransferase involved in cell wall biosynthesis|nr:MAG: glycosyltransferase [Candidatus Omnitrophota bacterium]
MRNNILIIVDNLAAGGAQRQIIEYLKLADKNIFYFKVVNLDSDVTILENDIKQIGLEVINIRHKGFFNLSTLFKLYKIIKYEKPAIVHTFLFTSDLYGRIAAKLAGIPVIISSVRNIDKWQKWHHRLADRILANVTDKITINAECIRPYLVNTKKLPKEKIVTIYNGIDLNRFDNLREPKSIKAELCISDKALMVGMVSRFSEQKDYDTLLKVAQEISKEREDVYFVCVGDGKLKPILDSRFSIRPKGVLSEAEGRDTRNIKFTGLRSDIPDLINAMDICVLSSHYEGCPNVILEYMACSKPVIASNVGGCAELVANGKSGFIVPPGDINSLKDKIVLLLDDKELRLRMGKEGRGLVEAKFISQRMVKETEGLYKQLLNPKIAYILSQFPETHETFILREIKALKEKGVDVKIISLKKCRDRVIHDEAKEFIKDTIYADVSVLRIACSVLSKPLRSLGALGYVLRSYFGKPWEFVKAMYVLAECLSIAPMLKKMRIKHMHSHWATMPTTAAVILNKLTGIPFSFTAHAWDLFIDCDGLEEKINKARFAVTCTGYNKNFMGYFCNNGQADKVYLNYHGLDLSKYVGGQGFKESRNQESKYVRDPQSAIRDTQYAIRTTQYDKISILAIGRLVETKGFEYLIEACGMLKERGIDFECFIVGQGPLEKRLAYSVERIELKDKIKFLGLQTQEQIKKLFSDASVLVQPSVMAGNGDRDGIPNVIIEAMALGVPVISTNFSGIPEVVIDKKTGILVQEKDSNELANAIENLHKDCYLTDKIIKNAREHVEKKFNIDTNVRELIEIFRSNGVL